jgi:hypothetical protein
MPAKESNTFCSIWTQLGRIVTNCHGHRFPPNYYWDKTPWPTHRYRVSRTQGFDSVSRSRHIRRTVSSVRPADVLNNTGFNGYTVARVRSLSACVLLVALVLPECCAGSSAAQHCLHSCGRHGLWATCGRTIPIPEPHHPILPPTFLQGATGKGAYGDRRRAVG